MVGPRSVAAQLDRIAKTCLLPRGDVLDPHRLGLQAQSLVPEPVTLVASLAIVAVVESAALPARLGCPTTEQVGVVEPDVAQALAVVMLVVKAALRLQVQPKMRTAAAFGYNQMEALVDLVEISSIFADPHPRIGLETSLAALRD